MLIHYDDLSPHNVNSRAVFTFRYHPMALPYTSPQGIITNKLSTLYQTVSPARLDLLVGIKQNQPPSIQQLARLLSRDYSIVWRDVRALEKLGLVQLRKASRGKAIKPTISIGKLVIEIPLLVD